MMRTPTLFPDDEEPGDWQNNRRRNEQPPPMLRHDATESSRNAAKRIRPKVRSQVARVFRFIANAGEAGATDKEIQNALQLSGDSQRPRRVWLRDNGFIQQKPDESRAGSAVWIVTGKSLELTPERKASA